VLNLSHIPHLHCRRKSMLRFEVEDHLTLQRWCGRDWVFVSQGRIGAFLSVNKLLEKRSISKSSRTVCEAETDISVYFHAYFPCQLSGVNRYTKVLKKALFTAFDTVYFIVVVCNNTRVILWGFLSSRILQLAIPMHSLI